MKKIIFACLLAFVVLIMPLSIKLEPLNVFGVPCQVSSQCASMRCEGNIAKDCPGSCVFGECTDGQCSSDECVGLGDFAIVCMGNQIVKVQENEECDAGLCVQRPITSLVLDCTKNLVCFIPGTPGQCEFNEGCGGDPTSPPLCNPLQYEQCDCSTVGQPPAGEGGGTCDKTLEGTIKACADIGTQTCVCRGGGTGDPTCSWTECPLKHTECVGQTCSYIEGDGVSECADETDCEDRCIPPDEEVCNTIGTKVCGEDGYWDPCSAHNECDLENETCNAIAGVGDDECAIDTECISHNECNAVTGKCELKLGADVDLCVVDDDCPCVEGSTNDDDCLCGGEKICDANGVWGDCPATHSVCGFNLSSGDPVCSCEVEDNVTPHCTSVSECPECVPGSTNDDDCLCGGEKICDANGVWGDCPPTHSVCGLSAEESVTCDCAVEDNITPHCTDIDDCVDCPADTHLGCENLQCGACISDEYPENTCATQSDCDTGYCDEGQYQTCVNQMCSCVICDPYTGCPPYSDCTTNAECENEPPYVTDIGIDSEIDCTGIQGYSSVSFSWYYHDAELDTQRKFIFQMDDDRNFLSPEYTKETITSSVPNIQLVLIGQASDVSYCDEDSTPGNNCFLQFGVPYYIRVMVTECVGSPCTEVASVWYYYSSSGTKTLPALATPYTKLGHPAPFPSFTYTSSSTPPKVNEPVVFTDTSTCYNDSGIYSCQNYNNYLWNFGDNETSTSFNPIHTYTTGGIKEVVLSICDESVCCPTSGITSMYSTSITVTGAGTGEDKDLPNWKEISPFQ